VRFNTRKTLKRLMDSLGPDYPVVKLPLVLPGISPTPGDFVGAGAWKTVHASLCGRYVYKGVELDSFQAAALSKEVLTLYQADAFGVPVALPVALYPESGVFVQEKLRPLHEAPEGALERFARSLPNFHPRVADVKIANVGYSPERDEVLVHDCLIREGVDCTTQTTPPRSGYRHLYLFVKVDDWRFCTLEPYFCYISRRSLISCTVQCLSAPSDWETWEAPASSPFVEDEISALQEAVKAKGAEALMRAFFASAALIP